MINPKDYWKIVMAIVTGTLIVNLLPFLAYALMSFLIPW